MSVFSVNDFDQHELVVFHHDKASGLNAIIAIHNTGLGPAVGGCRMYPYTDSTAALHDVLRLSRGMTFKSALAGLSLGGGKSVIMGDPHKDKSEKLLLAMADFVESLNGKYIVAEDSGTNVDDIKIMSRNTNYVSGLALEKEHQGDPSPSTAYGVFIGIETAVKHKLGVNNLQDIKVAVQGVGNVGYYLCKLLKAAGAKIYAADITQQNVERVVRQFDAVAIPVDKIMGIDVEVFSPCAMGAVINENTIKHMQAVIIAGAANNQLAQARHTDMLLERDILYAPDFVVNAGGIIDAYYQQQNGSDSKIKQHIEQISQPLIDIFLRVENEGLSTHAVAEKMAQTYLLNINARQQNNA